MRLILIGALVALAGCSGISVPLGGLGTATIHSNPAANAMRTCAALTDVLTPGVSPAAVVEIARNALGDVLALGNTPSGAMRNCAKLIDSIQD